MKTKTYLKILLVAILLITISIFNANIVNAVETQEQADSQNLLNNEKTNLETIKYEQTNEETKSVQKSTLEENTIQDEKATLDAGKTSEVGTTVDGGTDLNKGGTLDNAITNEGTTTNDATISGGSTTNDGTTTNTGTTTGGDSTTAGNTSGNVTAGGNTANQTTITTREIINLLPEIITIDIKEKEALIEENYEFKANKIIDEKVREIFVSNNIDFQTINIFDSTFWQDDGTINIHKAIITISDKSYNQYETKEITIKYSNTDEYNTVDEQYVQNKIKNANFNRLILVDIEENWPEWAILEQQYKDGIKNDIKDESIQFECMTGIGGFGGGDFSGYGVLITLYKNDILYATILGSAMFGNKVIISEQIEDTDVAYINYALPIVTKFFKQGNKWGDDVIVGLRKITDEEISALGFDDFSESDFVFKNDGTYYMVTKNGEDWARISFRKGNKIKVLDYVTIEEDTGVSIAGTEISKDNEIYNEMEEIVKEKGYNNIYNAYELELISGNIENGVTITFDIGTRNNGKEMIVIHKKHDGNYEEFRQKVENGKIAITVTELSPFMIASTEPLKSRVLDEEPNTGVESNIVLVSIIGIMSLCGIALLKFKK